MGLKDMKTTSKKVSGMGSKDMKTYENHHKEGLWKDIHAMSPSSSTFFQLQLGSHGPFVELDPTDMTSPIPPEQPSQIPPGQ